MNSSDTTRDGQGELETTSRRALLPGSGLLRVAGAASAAAVLAQRASASVLPTSQRKILVIVARGGMDGLSCVFPTGDAEYVTRRAGLALDDPPVGAHVPGMNRKLNNTFGLNAAAEKLYDIYANNDLAFVLGVGSPDKESLSHFAMQDFMEFGVEDGTAQDGKGWLSRYLNNTPPSAAAHLMDGIAIATALPKTIQQAVKTYALPDPTAHGLNGVAATVADREDSLELIYQQADNPLMSIGLGSIDLINGLAGLTISPTASYPPGKFGDSLAQVSTLFRAGSKVSPRAAVLEYNDWDDHGDQGPKLGGNYYNRLSTLSEGLRAFYDEMSVSSCDYQVFVVSEFGRRIDENTNLGSDHGRGGVMLAMGNEILGGQVYTRTGMPGSAVSGWDPAGLINHFDSTSGGSGMTENLLCNISWWDVIGEYLIDKCGVPAASLDPCVFPGFASYQPLSMFT